MKAKTMTALVALSLIAILNPAGAYADRLEELPTASDPKVDIFLVPAGHYLIGHAVGGEFVTEIAPISVGLDLDLGPTADCEADVGGGEWVPLTSNLLYPALPNRASAGECDGALWLSGSGAINYATFTYTATGDWWTAFAELALSSEEGAWEIECYPNSSPSVMAGAAAGVGSIFKNALEVENSQCSVSQWGLQPSAWSHHSGSISMWGTGIAYGSITTSWPTVGDWP